jgi:hypothetical protein
MYKAESFEICQKIKPLTGSGLQSIAKRHANLTIPHKKIKKSP